MMDRCGGTDWASDGSDVKLIAATAEKMIILFMV
jgi:hypothetical protein